MNYVSYSDLSAIIRDNIARLTKHQYDLVVGIPRSGMVPAYMIALALNLHCCTTVDLANNNYINAGGTRRTRRMLVRPQDAKKILLVDDSIMSGSTLDFELSRFTQAIKAKIAILTVISSVPNRKDVDFYFKYLPAPRVFEWNVFHSSATSCAAFDIDGVLCVDPTTYENDDGQNYLEFIASAEPLFIPTGIINTIVTCRLEKYREETQRWLQKHGIYYKRLEMLDLPSREAREHRSAYAQHKAAVYQSSGLELFIESDYEQALEIHRLTKKPVYCVKESVMINEDKPLPALLWQSRLYRKSFALGLFRKLPKPIYVICRDTYRRIWKCNWPNKNGKSD